MIELRLVDFLDVQSLFVDFQKKSKCYELPPDETEYIGLYADGVLTGYFGLIYQEDDNSVLILHGYLKAKYRHRGFDIKAMSLLEEAAKKAGRKFIRYVAGRSFRSYQLWAKNLGYKPENIIFCKELS